MNRPYDCARKTASAFSLGKVPDRYQRQDTGKSHEQTNRSSLSIWILHILLLGAGWQGPKNPWRRLKMLSRSYVPMVLVLFGHALDYEYFFFRVNQVIPRPNISQAIDPIPGFLEPFDCHDPK
jgi:hypothetical protein